MYFLRVQHTVLTGISRDSNIVSLLTCFETALCSPRTDDVVHISQPSPLNITTTHSAIPPKHIANRRVPLFQSTTLLHERVRNQAQKGIIRSGLFRSVAHHPETRKQSHMTFHGP